MTWHLDDFTSTDARSVQVRDQASLGQSGLQADRRAEPRAQALPAAVSAGARPSRTEADAGGNQDYGYLRVVVTASQLRIEFHPAGDGEGAKTPDDFVTVDLASRKLVHFGG
jgi:hypothetical protein